MRTIQSTDKTNIKKNAKTYKEFHFSEMEKNTASDRGHSGHGCPYNVCECAQVSNKLHRPVFTYSGAQSVKLCIMEVLTEGRVKKTKKQCFSDIETKTVHSSTTYHPHFSLHVFKKKN